MKIFVTGGTGFIGSRLCHFLLKNKHDVTIFDNNVDFASKSVLLLKKLGAQIIEGDISDFETLKNSLDYHDVIVHLAAKIDVKESFLNPKLTNQVNVLGTKNLLEAANLLEIKKIIAASSAAVYGNPKTVPVSETDSLNPLSPYGQSKLDMEKLMKIYSEKYDFHCVCLRFFNVFGIGQTNTYAGVITKFFQKISENDSLEIFGDGENTRDFVFVDDVADAILKTILNIENLKFEIFNVGTGVSISINELAKLILKISKTQNPIVFKSERPGDVKYSCADISTIKKSLNFVPSTTLMDGLQIFLKGSNV